LAGGILTPGGGKFINIPWFPGFFFAFLELLFRLTNASKPFTDRCFLKKSYSQADDPGGLIFAGFAVKINHSIIYRRIQ
jgi:hypothetical protein